jgi:hypothetical protein
MRYLKSINRKIINNTMTKKNKGQATTCKTLHRKLNRSSKMNPTEAPSMNSCFCSTSGTRRVSYVTNQVQIGKQSRHFYFMLKLNAVFSHSLRNQLSDLTRRMKKAYQKKA